MNYSKAMPEIEKVEGSIEVDTSLLIKLMYFQTYNSEKLQDAYIDFIQNDICKDIKGLKFNKDAYGNLYVIKGKNKKGEFYPCIVSHVDSVQKLKEDWELVIGSKFIYGFDNTIGEQCGTSADDRCGNYFSIEMLKRLPKVKVIFTKNEEVG